MILFGYMTLYSVYFAVPLFCLSWSKKWRSNMVVWGLPWLFNYLFAREDTCSMYELSTLWCCFCWDISGFKYIEWYSKLQYLPNFLGPATNLLVDIPKSFCWLFICHCIPTTSNCIPQLWLPVYHFLDKPIPLSHHQKLHGISRWLYIPFNIQAYSIKSL